jgi:hypothetical protein
MKTIKYVCALLSIMFITVSCNKDDEELEIERTTGVTSFKVTPNLSSDGTQMELTINVGSNINYADVRAFVVYKNTPGQWPGFANGLSLETGPNGFSRTFSRPLDNVLKEDLKVTIEVAQFTTNEIDSYQKATGVVNPQNVEIEYPTAPVRSIYLKELEINDEGATLLHFERKSDEGIQPLEGQIISNSNPLGDSFDLNVNGIGSGVSELLNFPGLDPDDYEIQFNDPYTNDPYTFVDANGMPILNQVTGQPVTSISLEYVIPLLEEVSAAGQAEFTDTTTGGTTVTLPISKNFSDARDILTELRSAGGNVIDSLIVKTTNGSQNEDIVASFPTKNSGITLNMDTKYDVYWKFEGEEFWNASFTTATPGQFGAADGTIDMVTPNDGRVQLITTNITGDDVSGIWKFEGIDIYGNTIDTETAVTISDGSVNQIMYMETFNHKQNSEVSYQLMVNGTPHPGTVGSFKTSTIPYTNEKLVQENGGVVNANQGNSPVFTLIVDAGGIDFTKNFELRITMPTGQDPNMKIDNIKIGDSGTLDVTFTLISGDTWKIDFNESENIIVGSNSYEVGIGGENFVPSGGVGTTDVAQLTMMMTDSIGNSTVVSNSIDITFM